MPFLDEKGVKTLWSEIVARFSRTLKITPQTDNVLVQLQTKQDTDSSYTDLKPLGIIPTATQSQAGVMSNEDKAKLDGVESGATANKGTITKITSTSPILGSGDSGQVKLSHANVGNAGTYGTTSTSDISLSFGQKFEVPALVTNATGHVSSASTHKVKVPDSLASESSSGLMSGSDKKKLNSIEAGATANNGTITKITSESPILGQATEGPITISHDVSGVTAGGYGDASETDVEPKFGENFNVPGFVVNDTGHVRAANTHLVKVPDNIATKSAKGLMSSQDKEKLDDIDVGATKNTVASSKPSMVELESDIGASSKYAREDHVHGISVGEGSKNGQINICGQDINVKGLQSAAYTDSNSYAKLDSNGKLVSSQLPDGISGVSITVTNGVLSMS